MRTSSPRNALAFLGDKLQVDALRSQRTRSSRYLCMSLSPGFDTTLFNARPSATRIFSRTTEDKRMQPSPRILTPPRFRKTRSLLTRCRLLRTPSYTRTLTLAVAVPSQLPPRLAVRGPRGPSCCLYLLDSEQAHFKQDRVALPLLYVRGAILSLCSC